MADCQIAFPPSPIVGTAQLVPIASWHDMFREAEVTGVEFDIFWIESVENGIAYFFSWLGEPRSTVLVVFDRERPTHIECRKRNDLEVSPTDSLPIVAEVTQAFKRAGFWREEPVH